MTEIPYDITFLDTVDLINNSLERWFAGPKTSPPDIDSFAEPVYFKSSDGVIVHNNEAYREFFSDGITATGRIATTFLDKSIISISQHTDALICAGVEYVEFEHVCYGPENRWYSVRSYKRRLMQHNDGAYDILGISRPISFDDDSNPRTPLENAFEVYSSFDLRDKRICMLLAEGSTMPEIGVLLDVSSKTIDNRRKKIMASLQYQTPIDIVKMMVRFEERGFEI